MNARQHRDPVVHDRLEDQIRHEAFLLWQQEGRPRGRELEHWYAAREIVRHRQPESELSFDRLEEEPVLQEAGPRVM